MRGDRVVHATWEARRAAHRGRTRDLPNFRGVLDAHRPLAYTIGMEFEWDDAKNNACFVRRGFDFAYAVRAFFDP